FVVDRAVSGQRFVVDRAVSGQRFVVDRAVSSQRFVVDRAERLHVGYILKQYPRLSETFILNEILGLEAYAATVSVFSLRHADEGRFHPALASVRASVSYPRTVDKTAFLDAISALPRLHADRLPSVLEFVDRLPADRRARVLLDAIAVAEQADANGITHLHAHFLTIAAHTAHIVHLLTGLPYTVTAHAKDIYRHTVDWELAAHVGRHATAVITVCDANLAFLAERLAGSGTTLARVYNGLGPQEPAAPMSDRIPGLVLGVGRLVEKKGFDLLIDAVAKLVPRRPEISCVIIGDGDRREALEAQAGELGIDDRITFAGAQPQHEVADWLRRAHVLAAPCRVGADGNQDALPTVLLEALGAGLPAVTTPVAGIPEIVEHGREGLIVDVGDAAALACGIETLLDDGATWQSMSGAGPVKLAGTFDRRATVAQLVDTIAAGRRAA
ncbi:MAG: glycosyltransferase, partial [Acidimicrobiia bacterium]|nr:glycosyltransferase [Acidimicrobiia bacterium]